MKRLDGKIALITGAAQGMGRGIALCLAAEGAHVIINDIGNQEVAAETAAAVRDLGSEVLIHYADVAQREAVQELVAAGVAHFGRLDIVVANAAASVREPVAEAAWEHVERTLAVSQFGVFHTCQAAVQQMLKQELSGRARGKIVMIGSVHQKLAVPRSAAYNMAKAAINHLARTMAAELAADKINVNVVNPGWVDTPGERQFSSAEALETGGRRIPWGRIGQPEDIGKAVAFLVSDDADYITGAALRVDGGFVLGLTLPSRPVD